MTGTAGEKKPQILSAAYYVVFELRKHRSYSTPSVHAISVRKTRPNLSGNEFAVKMKLRVPENYLDRCQVFVDMAVKQDEVALPTIEIEPAPGEGEKPSA